MRYNIDPISADKGCLVNIIGLYLKTLRNKPVETTVANLSGRGLLRLDKIGKTER